MLKSDLLCILVLSILIYLFFGCGIICCTPTRIHNHTSEHALAQNRNENLGIESHQFLAKISFFQNILSACADTFYLNIFVKN